MEVKKSDFTFFQNEILQDMKKLENKVNNTLISKSNNVLEKVNLNKDNIEEINKKVFEIIKIVNNDEEKIKINSTINKFKTKIEEFIFTNNTKMSSLEKQFNDVCFKYDKLIISNLTSPGFIGKGCEYSNVRSFLEYSREKLKELFSAKDNQNKEFKIYKEKLDTLINQFKLQMNLSEAKFSIYVNDALKKFEVRMNERFKEFDDKILNNKADNIQFTNEMKKKMEELDEQSEKMNKFKEDILIKINKNIAEIKRESIKNKNEIESFKMEFKGIKTKFNEVNDNVKEFKNMINKSQNANLTNNNYVRNQSRYLTNRNSYINMAYEKNKQFNEDLLNIKFNMEKNSQENIINNNNQKIFLENDKKNIKEDAEKAIDKESLNNKIDNINKNDDTTKIILNNDDRQESKNNNNIKNFNVDEIKDNVDEIKEKNLLTKFDKEKINKTNNDNFKKVNNINYNHINNNINGINSQNENNINIQKKELITKELITTPINRAQENRQNDISNILRENNFRKKIKSEDKMNKTYNNKFIITRRYSIINKDVPTISIVNYLVKKPNFNDKENKKKINDMNEELNYNSDCVTNSKIHLKEISDLRIINFNKKIKKNENILNLIKTNNIRNNKILYNKDHLSDDTDLEKEHFIEKKDKLCLSDDNNLNENEKYLNKDEFYSQMKETKKNINELYFTFNKKIHKLTRQIKNLSAEIFNYYFANKLNKKFSTCNTNNNSLGKSNLNSVIDLTSTNKELKERKLNKKFISKINDKSFTEEQKMNSKLLLKKLDSFLIKKFKE